MAQIAGHTPVGSEFLERLLLEIHNGFVVCSLSFLLWKLSQLLLCPVLRPIEKVGWFSKGTEGEPRHHVGGDKSYCE